MLKTLYEYKKHLNEKGVFFSFCGPISQELLVELAEMLNRHMELEAAGRAVATRVFALVVETAQNIMHYSDERRPFNEQAAFEEQMRLGILAVGYDAGKYFVVSGNMINNTRVDEMRNRLDRLNEMDSEALKHLYKSKRKEKPADNSKGAGLGWIEMARIATRPIEYEFRILSDSHSFFSTKITL
jgi:hypothetical protein